MCHAKAAEKFIVRLYRGPEKLLLTTTKATVFRITARCDYLNRGDELHDCEQFLVSMWLHWPYAIKSY